MSETSLPARSILVKQHLDAAGVREQIRVLPDSARAAVAAGHPHTVMPLTFESLRALTSGEVIAVAR